MISAPTYLENYRAVVDAFGYWPSFHDAPVLEFVLSEDRGRRIELMLHGWEMTREVDEAGFYKTIKHHRVRFAFTGVFEENLEDFATESILDALVFSPVGDFERTGAFSVLLDSALGCDVSGSFSATAGVVMEVAAGAPDSD